MADQRIRELERAARHDPAAQARLVVARERRGEIHPLGEHLAPHRVVMAVGAHWRLGREIEYPSVQTPTAVGLIGPPQYGMPWAVRRSTLWAAGVWVQQAATLTGLRRTRLIVALARSFRQLCESCDGEGGLCPLCANEDVPCFEHRPLVAPCEMCGGTGVQRPVGCLARWRTRLAGHSRPRGEVLWVEIPSPDWSVHEDVLERAARYGYGSKEGSCSLQAWKRWCRGGRWGVLRAPA